MNRENILESELIGILEDLDETHMEISELRAQVAELVSVLTDVIDGGECVWSDGYICPIVTPALKKQAKAVIAAAEGDTK